MVRPMEVDIEIEDSTKLLVLRALLQSKTHTSLHHLRAKHVGFESWIFKYDSDLENLLTVQSLDLNMHLDLNIMNQMYSSDV